MLAWHARARTRGSFPRARPVVPHIVTSYELDHRGLDLAFDGLAAAVADSVILSTSPAATSACKFHLDMHLYKEDVDLYLVFMRELRWGTRKAAAVRVFTDAAPADRFGDLRRWLFPLVDVGDREKVVRVWHSAMPIDMLTGSLRLVNNASRRRLRLARPADRGPGAAGLRTFAPRANHTERGPRRRGTLAVANWSGEAGGVPNPPFRTPTFSTYHPLAELPGAHDLGADPRANSCKNAVRRRRRCRRTRRSSRATIG